jgi:hypothetical protein
MSALLLLAALAAPAADAHEESNLVYKELRRGETALGPKTRVSLPAPYLPDGLDAPAQRRALASLPGLRVPLDELLRNAIGAPFVLDIGELRTSPDRLRTRTIDLCFVAHGDLDVFESHKNRAEFTFTDQTRVHVLSAQELARRNIRLDPAARDTRWSHGIFSVLERVQLSLTTCSTMSRTAESVVLAGKLDPRFTADAEFPNRWQDLDLQSDGTRKLGPPRPYVASVFYTKCTRLHEPRGALLVEYHMILEQPEDWFGGADLLRSKLPIAMQKSVRSFREDLRRAPRPAP